MSTPWVISCYTVRPLLEALDKDLNQAMCSLDLGVSTQKVIISTNQIVLPDDTVLTRKTLETVQKESQSCFIVVKNTLEKIQAYSQLTGRYYSLYPTERAPTMLISGIPMHRIKDTNPNQDTQAKIHAAHPVGEVLDTATGLGYTAISATRTAEHVITMELDPTVLEICRFNPWSADLFQNPRIIQRIGDSFELIQEFPDGTFSRVIHDPPTFSLAGDLYSMEFYTQVFRVLRPSGRLFHYIGDLNSPSGRRVSRGATQRLIQAGFVRVIPHPQAFALVAYKR